MYSSGDFSRCEKSRDSLSILIQHFRYGINLQSAHRMMDCRCNFNRIERCSIQCFRKACSAKLGILFLCNSFIPAVHRLFKLFFRNAHCFAEALIVLTCNRVAGLNVPLNNSRLFYHLVVENKIYLGTGLGYLRLGNGISGSHFIRKTLSFLINKDCTVAS